MWKMSMTMRETQADRDREAAVAKRLQQSEGWLLIEMPSAYRVDYGISADGGGGSLQGAVEIKSRNGCWGDYPTIVCNLGKVMWMQQLAAHIPNYLAIHTRHDDRLHVA